MNYQVALNADNLSNAHDAVGLSSRNVELEFVTWVMTGLILRLRPANERRRYFVTTSLIGWAQA